MNLTVFTHYYYHYSKKKTKKKKTSKLVEEKFKEKFKENYCNSFVLQTTHPPLPQKNKINNTDDTDANK